jgi:hypothetical protein
VIAAIVILTLGRWLSRHGGDNRFNFRTCTLLFFIIQTWLVLFTVILCVAYKTVTEAK